MNSLRIKTGLSSIALLCVVLGFATSGFFKVNTIQDNSKDLQQTKRNLDAMHQLLVHETSLQDIFFQVVFEGQAMEGKLLDRSNFVVTKIEATLTELSEHSNKASHKNLRYVVVIFKEFLAKARQSQKVLDTVYQEKTLKDFQTFRQDVQKEADELESYFNHLIDDNWKLLQDLILVMSIGFVTTFFGVIIYFFFIHKIVQSVRIIQRQLKEISSGDFKESSQKVLRQDELGDLQLSLDEARYHLKQNQEEIQKQNFELKVSYEKASEANHAKSDFIAMMGHEIRTPLNGILPNTEMMLDGILKLKPKLSELHLQLEKAHPFKTQLQEFVAMILAHEELLIVQQESGILLSSIIDEILDTVKIQTYDVVLSPKTENLRSLCRNLISFQKNSGKLKGIEVLLDMDDSIKPTCLIDGLLLRRVLNNLINNAIKFTQNGHVKLKLHLISEDATGQKVQFEVSDTGVGINPEHIDLIFEAFKQEDNSVSRHTGGTGLGLYICKKIIQKMASDIEVTSEKGKGSQFSFVLKLDSCPELESSPLHQAEAANFSGIKVLGVDDNLLNCKVLSKLLESLGTLVTTSISGEEALKLLKEEWVEVIFMDYHMPGMDGYETSRRIRALENDKKAPPTYIIACTADAQETKSELYLQAGMNDIIVKPISKRNVSEALVRYLKSKESP